MEELKNIDSEVEYTIKLKTLDGKVKYTVNVETVRDAIEKLYSSGERDFSFLDLSGTDLRYINIQNCDLTGSNLANVMLTDSDLSGSILCNVNFTSSDLNRVYFSYSDLTDSDLTGAYLSKSVLIYSNLTNVKLGNANTYGIKLDGAILCNTDLDYQIQEGLIKQIAEVVLNNPERLYLGIFDKSSSNSYSVAGWACRINKTAKKLQEFYGTETAGIITLGEIAHSYSDKSEETVLNWLKTIE